MSHTLTSKGQVTIPKKIRDTLGLAPGSQVDFDIDEQGRIVIRKAGTNRTPRPGRRERFDRVRGGGTIKWKTDELMALLRGDD